MLTLQLQRFAGEKTERATPQRRREARREGKLPKSADLTASVVLVGALIALKLLGPLIWWGWYSWMTNDLSHLDRAPLTTLGVAALLNTQLWLFIRMVGPFVGVVLLLGVFTAFVQVGPMFLPKLLVPDFNRIQPLNGFKRFFAPKTFVEAGKSVAKLLIVGLLTYISVFGVGQKITAFSALDIQALPASVARIAFQLGLQIALFMLVLSALDFFFQRYDFEKSIRMSRQDIKEENKRQEGDPQVKARIRQRGRALAMRRMMQEVPRADVIITNPTHYAIALRYDGGKMAAPVVIAKGQDDMARRIRQVAADAGVPRVENKPLAQALYKAADIGTPVPADLYQAVAEVLAYVYRLKQSVREGGAR